jgi:hypothetical protein
MQANGQSANEAADGGPATLWALPLRLVWSTIAPVPTADEVMPAIADCPRATRKKGLKVSTICLADDRQFGELAHRRYIRFGSMVIDAGLEVFQGGKVCREVKSRLHEKQGTHLTKKEVLRAHTAREFRWPDGA